MRNWADVPTGLIVDMLKEIGGDGHSIFPTEYFVKKWKIPEEVIKYNERTLVSDPKNPKTMIFKDGEALDKLTGVFLLDLQYTIADNLDLSEVIAKAGQRQGRGFQAQELRNGIMEYLKCE